MADARGASKPPRSPYPPDTSDDEPPELVLRDLVDVIAVDADWAGERAQRAGLQRVELRRCRLTGAELAEASLRDVVFEDCRIDVVGVRHAKLERVVFRDCRMPECDFYGSSLEDVLFERCELREATFSACTLERVEFRGCDLAGLRGVDALRGARLLWNDVIENAALFATALGVEIIEQ